MITATQAQEYLSESLGVSVPSFIAEAAVATVAAVEQRMVDAGYDAAKHVLVQTYAVAIIAAAGAPRPIASQGAPSGALQSVKNFDDSLTQLRRRLTGLDTAGINGPMVGADPATNTLFMVDC